MSDLVNCPFDKNHYLKPSRLAYHLVKCSKNFPNCELKRCPYNATHYIPEAEMNAHFKSCDDWFAYSREEMEKMSELNSKKISN